MAWYAKFDGVDGSSESRSAPSVSEIVVTKSTDVGATVPFYLKLEGVDGDVDTSGGGMGSVSWGLDRIDQRAPAASAGEFPYIVSFQQCLDGPAGINALFADGSVRDPSPQDAALFAYDQGFLGGVTVAAGDIDDGFDPYGEAIGFAGDGPVHEEAIGGLAVGDVEAKGPLLMHVGFMF